MYVSFLTRILRSLFGDRSTYGPFLMARSIAVHGQTNCGKPNQTSHLPCGNAFFCTLSEQFAAIKEKNKAKMRRETQKVNVRSAFIIDNSTHRDESIYKNSFLQKLGVTNRDESKWCESLCCMIWDILQVVRFIDSNLRLNVHDVLLKYAM